MYFDQRIKNVRMTFSTNLKSAEKLSRTFPVAEYLATANTFRELLQLL
jgi:hypothetical protein